MTPSQPGTGTLSRRHLLRHSAAVAVAGLFAPHIARAQETTRLVIRDPGGDWNTAATAAFYTPFSEQTGIEIVPVAAGPDPVAQVQAMVQSGSYTWDILNATSLAQGLLGERNLLEEIDWSTSQTDGIPEHLRTKWYMPTDVYASVISFRSDVLAGGPASWADIFSGNPDYRIALRRSPVDTLEQALLADGVAAQDLYPLDVDRAFRVLDRIKDNVVVWWTSGAQATQLLTTAEANVCATFNSRAQTAIDSGAPVEIRWDKALYSIEGWAILKGTPNAGAAQKFAQFCADPVRQAAFSQRVSFGPVNPDAYEHISLARAAVLPTNPAHFPGMVNQSADFWIANQTDLTEKFNDWLVS